MLRIGSDFLEDFVDRFFYFRSAVSYDMFFSTGSKTVVKEDPIYMANVKISPLKIA